MTLYWACWWALRSLSRPTVCTYRRPGVHDPAAHLVLVALWPLVGLAMTLIDLPSAAPRLPSGRAAAGSPAAAARPPQRRRRPESLTGGTPDAR